MKERLEIRNNKKHLEVNYYYGKDKAVYHNLLDNDANKLALILLDLEAVSNLPIYKAVAIYLEKRNKKDWLGL